MKTKKDYFNKCSKQSSQKKEELNHAKSIILFMKMLGAINYFSPKDMLL